MLNVTSAPDHLSASQDPTEEAAGTTAAGARTAQPITRARAILSKRRTFVYAVETIVVLLIIPEFQLVVGALLSKEVIVNVSTVIPA